MHPSFGADLVLLHFQPLWLEMKAHGYKRGETVDEIVQEHPHLSAASVYDAISYYLDHQKEIKQEILENRMETLMETERFSIDDRGFVRFDESPSSE